MTTTLVQAVYLSDSGATASSRAVLVAMAWRARDDNVCRVSLTELARMTRLARSTVQTAVELLVSEGVIASAGVTKGVKGYTLHLDEVYRPPVQTVPATGIGGVPTAGTPGYRPPVQGGTDSRYEPYRSPVPIKTRQLQDVVDPHARLHATLAQFGITDQLDWWEIVWDASVADAIDGLRPENTLNRLLMVNAERGRPTSPATFTIWWRKDANDHLARLRAEARRDAKSDDDRDPWEREEDFRRGTLAMFGNQRVGS